MTCDKLGWGDFVSYLDNVTLFLAGYQVSCGLEYIILYWEKNKDKSNILK